VLALVFCFASSVQSGITLNELGQVNFVFEQKLGWTTQGTLLSTIGLLGLALGSLLGSKLIILNGKRSVKNVVIGLNLVSFFGNALKLHLSFGTILAGRIIVSICSGSLNICYQKIVQETVPNEVLQFYGLTFNSGICFGIFWMGLISALIVPHPEDGIEELQNNESWRLVFGQFMLLQVVCMIVIQLFYKNPSLKDCLQHGSD
jgi:MFS family permease